VISSQKSRGEGEWKEKEGEKKGERRVRGERVSGG